MTQAIQKKLNDSAFARWTALILVALTMFFGYMFVDVLSPLQMERIVDDPCVIAVFTQAFAQFLLHVPVVEQITHFRQGAVGAMEQLLR